MQTSFSLNQANDGVSQFAHLFIPACSNHSKPGSPPIVVEIEDGKITLLVYGDVNSQTPTHEIDLSGALEASRERKKTYAELPTEDLSGAEETVPSRNKIIAEAAKALFLDE